MSEQKVVILHGFRPEEALVAMRALKSALASAGEAAFATTTETNLGWKVGDLIDHIAEEHRLYKGLPKKV